MASAGVLYVWLSRAFSSAIGRLRNAGCQRPDAAIVSMRAIAAGEQRANHSPPSEPKAFWAAN